jgi:pyridoxal phosphate enzyme (YggS family)
MDSLTLEQRLEAVRARMAQACARVGRDPGGVRLIAVSKMVGPDDIAEAARAGLEIFGESRVQEAAQKMARCPGHVEWHMIGHLQRNKVKFVPGLFRMVQSIDSLKLLEALNLACEEDGCRIQALLEVNVSGESSKFGMAPAAVPEVLARCASLSRVDVRGFMTIPPFQHEAEAARAFFRALRELRDGCRVSSGLELPELSMGMSNDFEVAIEEGATMIRLGTILFGERKNRAAATDTWA